MTDSTKLKTLVKILIGTAWIDGQVQPKEREYLQRIAAEHGLVDDPEVAPLLQESRTVTPVECYAWVKQYLGNQPDQANYQELLEAISGLIYSDDDVASEEAQLLSDLQQLDPATAIAGGEESNVLLKSIRQLYRNWMAKL